VADCWQAPLSEYERMIASRYKHAYTKALPRVNDERRCLVIGCCPLQQ
jgi:hypothetical protein